MFMGFMCTCESGSCVGAITPGMVKAGLGDPVVSGGPPCVKNVVI